MNKKNVKGIIQTTVVIGAVGIAAVNYVQVLRTERKKRQQIDINLDLDLQAIDRTAIEMLKKINNGDYDRRSIVDLMNDFDTETKFQQIAIREDF